MLSECGGEPTSFFIGATWKEAKTTTARVLRPALPETVIGDFGSDTAKEISQAQNAGESDQSTNCNAPAGFMDAVFHEDSV
ncbi:MAG: hypothetical protein K0M55_10295 [Rhizobium sp.]|nr:hypothetical protein [Rhizobium sp.]